MTHLKDFIACLLVFLYLRLLFYVYCVLVLVSYRIAIVGKANRQILIFFQIILQYARFLFYVINIYMVIAGATRCFM